MYGFHCRPYTCVTCTGRGASEGGVAPVRYDVAEAATHASCSCRPYNRLFSYRFHNGRRHGFFARGCR